MKYVEERIYTIPLRSVFRVPRTRRAKKAISVIREFLKRHMKVEEVIIGNSINETVWSKGLKKPPRRIRIHAVVHEGKVYSELLGVDIKLPEKKEEKKKEEREEKSEEAKEGKTSEEEKTKDVKEEDKEEVKSEEKSEQKEE